MLELRNDQVFCVQSDHFVWQTLITEVEIILIPLAL
jgi:hypothetical protein